MFKSLAVSTLILGSVLAFAQPQVAAARDRDDYRYGYNDNRGQRGWRDNDRHEREEWREHERWEHNRRFRDYRRGYGYYNRGGYNNSGGYYDSYGYWHSYGY